MFIADCINTSPILGLNTIEKLQLLHRVPKLETFEVKEDLSQDYVKRMIYANKNLFEGIGNLDYVYDFKLKPGYTGKIEPCRKVPFKVLDDFKNALSKMESDKIIDKIEEPTEFVNAFTLIKKENKSLVIVLDPQHLNSCLLRGHFSIPTFEEISAKVHNAKIFTVLDASKAFWQVKLSEESSKLTTFQTPFGRFRFLRMPYGIKTAPEIFHRIYTDAFKDIPNLVIYIDDILIWANSEKEMQNTLEKVFSIAKQKGIRFNLNKCKIGVPEVKFTGHVFSKNGIAIDDSSIEAILKMKKPTDKKGVERLLGILTYRAKFIPNASELTAPLRELIKNRVEFNWTNIHDEAFEKIKKCLTDAPILKYYNPNLPSSLSVDASQSGVGAVLLQSDHPVAYASKAFTTT